MCNDRISFVTKHQSKDIDNCEGPECYTFSQPTVKSVSARSELDPTVDPFTLHKRL